MVISFNDVCSADTGMRKGDGFLVVRQNQKVQKSALQNKLYGKWGDYSGIWFTPINSRDR